MRTRVLLAAAAALSLVPAVAQAASPAELSTSNRLQDRREVAAGDRAYAAGFEDGRFYANGWHITGEMGGVWAPPLKLVDGVWFGVDDQWVGPATKFTSGWGYTRYDLPDADGLHAAAHRLRARRQPRRALRPQAHQLRQRPTGRSRSRVDAHSELMSAYPWGFSGVTPNASDNLPDHGAFADGALQFTDDGALPGAPEHHYAALVGGRPGARLGQGGGDRRHLPRRARATRVCQRRRPGRRRAAATTGRSATAPAASCATRSPSRRGGSRRCGSRSRARTRAWRPRRTSSPPR